MKLYAQKSMRPSKQFGLRECGRAVWMEGRKRRAKAEATTEEHGRLHSTTERETSACAMIWWKKSMYRRSQRKRSQLRPPPPATRHPPSSLPSSLPSSHGSYNGTNKTQGVGYGWVAVSAFYPDLSYRLAWLGLTELSVNRFAWSDKELSDLIWLKTTDRPTDLPPSLARETPIDLL